MKPRFVPVLLLVTYVLLLGLYAVAPALPQRWELFFIFTLPLSLVLGGLCLLGHS